MRPGRLRSAMLAILAAAGAAGCDVGSPAPAACAEAGAQCRLAEGPLGVCERARCQAGRAEPCFRCVPQH